MLVTYSHLGKSYLLSDGEYLKRRIEARMASIYFCSDREHGGGTQEEVGSPKRAESRWPAEGGGPTGPLDIPTLGA